MKVPFRQQASEFDCVPTTFINALCYLFHRQEIPPFVVRQIYKECLDITGGKGTSGSAVEDIAHWLTNYREKAYSEFHVKSRCIYGRQVHLRQRGMIRNCLDNNGVAVLTIHSSRQYTHAILALHCDGEQLHCYDPHPHSKRYIKDGSVTFIPTTGQEPNLIISCDRLERTIANAPDGNACKYILGNIDDRECLLLHRITP